MHTRVAVGLRNHLFSFFYLPNTDPETQKEQGTSLGCMWGRVGSGSWLLVSRGPTLAGLEWLSFSELFSFVQREGAKALEKRDSFK